MTEQDKDNSRPKLRLSLEPKNPENAPATEPEKPEADPVAPEADPDQPESNAAKSDSAKLKPRLAEPTAEPPATKPAAEPEEKPNLQLRRPGAQPVAAEPKPPEAAPVQPAVASAPLDPVNERVNEPESPLQKAQSADEPDEDQASPSKLPVRLVPTPGSATAQAAAVPVPAPKEANDEAHHKKSLLISIIIIAGLIALLGACAYGLYYVLQSPSEAEAVTEFLKQSHIGGVRMGEHPKLLLNGLNYDPGDLIDPATGLRFKGLRDKKLVFQDAQDVLYIKSF